MNLKAKGRKIIVKPVKPAPMTTDGGIILPNEEQNFATGQIIAVGSETGDYSVNEIIVFSRHAGSFLKVSPTEAYVVLSVDDVLAVVN